MKKFCYNPFTGQFFDCGYSDHSTKIYNKGNQSIFDDYIRGLIDNGTLYLRTYCPFDYDSLTLKTLKEKSLKLLKFYDKKIFEKIKKEYDLSITNVIYNATNDLLKIDLKRNFI